MSAAQRPTPIGFSLYDLLTRIVPGSLLLVFFIIASLPFINPQSITVFMNIDTSLVSIIFLASGFVFGELIDNLRMETFAAPYMFRQLFYERNNSKPPLYDRRKKWSRSPPTLIGISDKTVESVFAKSNETFGDFNDPNEMYLHIYIHVSPQLSPLTDQYQTTTIFLQNIRIVTWLSSIVILLSVIIVFLLGRSGLEFVLIFSFFLTLAVFAFLLIFHTAEEIYLRLLFTEFYQQ